MARSECARIHTCIGEHACSYSQEIDQLQASGDALCSLDVRLGWCDGLHALTGAGVGASMPGTAGWHGRGSRFPRELTIFEEGSGRC